MTPIMIDSAVEHLKYTVYRIKYQVRQVFEPLILTGRIQDIYLSIFADSHNQEDVGIALKDKFFSLFE
jgi:hypothetical protein